MTIQTLQEKYGVSLTDELIRSMVDQAKGDVEEITDSMSWDDPEALQDQIQHLAVYPESYVQMASDSLAEWLNDDDDFWHDTGLTPEYADTDPDDPYWMERMMLVDVFCVAVQDFIDDFVDAAQADGHWEYV